MNKAIIINGKKFFLPGKYVDYETICRLADVSLNVTMTYFNKNESGTLKPGEKVKLVNNMVFNAIYTGDA